MITLLKKIKNIRTYEFAALSRKNLIVNRLVELGFDLLTAVFILMVIIICIKIFN